MALDYSSYLQIDRLLELQVPESSPPEHDELLFIVIHQVYELWFKLLLHEFDKAGRDLSGNDLFAASDSFRRASKIMKTLVHQLDVLETMTPLSFTRFRDYLESSSGFQSVQFRELEFLLGYKRPETLEFSKHDAAGQEKLQRRLRQPSLVDHFHEFLEQRGVRIPLHVRERNLEAATVPDQVVQDGILKLYKTKPDLRILFELMTDYDEGQQEWRYRHVKVVERTVGNKRGTGGSLGVDFLKKSLFVPLFPDLWAIRHRF